MTTNETVRVGIIGTGSIAEYAHMPGYRSVPGVEVVAACDVVPGKAALFAEKWGIPRAYDGHRAMLEAEELDAVSVCTPNCAHKETSIDALNAGVHVLCEKPMAMNLAEAKEMAATARRTGKVLQIGLHWRFTSEAQALKRYADAGDLGDIYYGEATYWRRRGIPGWGVFTQKRMQGGGALIDIGVHTLDHTMWLMGNPRPVSVLGATYAIFGKREDVVTPRARWDPTTFDVDDTAFAMVRFDNGATLILRATWAANVDKSFGETRILGSKGGAFMSPLTIYAEQHGMLVNVTPVELPEVKPHHKEIEHFVSCVRGETDCLVKLEQVLDVQAVLDAIYGSSETGHEAAVKR